MALDSRKYTLNGRGLTNHTGATMKITLDNIFRKLRTPQITHCLSGAAGVHDSRSPHAYFFEQFVCTPLDDGRHGSKNVQERGEVVWWSLRKLE